MCMVGTLGAWAQTTSTFDFSTRDGLLAMGVEEDRIPTSSGESNAFKGNWEYTMDGSVTFNSTSGTTTTAIYGSSNQKDFTFRIYKDGTMTLSVGEGSVITKIVFTADGSNFGLNGLTDSKNKTWEGNAQSVEFTATKTNRIKTIAVTYESSSTSPLADPELSFASSSCSGELEANDGQIVTPTLTNPYNLPVTWSSSNQSVVSDGNIQDGSVKATSAGKTTITATFAGNDTYRKASVSYDLTVTSSAVTPPSDNDGSFEKPFTPSELLSKGKNDVDYWVKGIIVGAALQVEPGYSTENKQLANTNFALGDEAPSGDYSLKNTIAVQLTSTPLRNVAGLQNQPSVIGKQVMVYGTRNDYFSRTGFKPAKKIYGLTELAVNTAEGYATFYTNCAFEVPADMQCGLVTGVDGGALTIDYRYGAGSIVPAETPVLVKADGMTTVALTYTNSTTRTPSDNLLVGAAKTGEFTAQDGYLYYKLAYDNYTDKTGLGFYWGGADGGVFSVPAGKAYLALPQEVANGAQAFRFDGAVTGIDNAAAAAPAAAKHVYTLDGRRVNSQNLPAGLYIVNGKKVIIK